MIHETPIDQRPVRCAIYTRKSREAPPGQEVTSIETQRTICAAYVASQQHKCWQELQRRYDDAAQSGATLQRPALQQLMADIELGLVDVVIVYKLDRISRTLLDFVRLIDLFDRHAVTFVAITQNFDTSDSMGRLIRNVLLTFAQFEREISGDRIRDKKFLSKQQGRWTGGDAPIGYDLRRGKLFPNRQEGPAIRYIYETYVRTKSLTAVHKKLQEWAFVRKVWRTREGKLRGGQPISYSALDHVLANPIYLGEVSYKGQRFPGIHAPLVDRELWERVQEIRRQKRLPKPRNDENLFTGFIYDSSGRRMYGRIGSGCPRNRYYQSAVVSWATADRIPIVRAVADQLERLVVQSLAAVLSDRQQLSMLLMKLVVHGRELEALSKSGSRLARELVVLDARQLNGVLRSLIEAVEIHPAAVLVLIRLNSLRQLLQAGLGGDLGRSPGPVPGPVHCIAIPVTVDRHQPMIGLPLAERPPVDTTPNLRLVSLLEDAREAQALIYKNRDIPLIDLAYSLGRKPRSFARLVRLNYLAPDIIAAIVDGTQPKSLTRKRLSAIDLPIDWHLQRRLLGFSQPNASAGLHSAYCVALGESGHQSR